MKNNIKLKEEQGNNYQHDEIQLKIKDLNDRGEGLAFHKKYRILIPKTLPGEEVLIRYFPNRSRKDRIHLHKIINKSSQRVDPPCTYFQNCSGCHLQHMNVINQLEFKRNLIRKLLLAYPKLRHLTIHKVVENPQNIHYRNKCQIPFQMRKNQIVFGLYRKGTHEITVIKQCLVESGEANQILKLIQQWAIQYQIQPYNERKDTGILKYAVIRKGQFTNQLMIIIVSRVNKVPYVKELVEMLINAIATLKSIIINYNAQMTNKILGQKNTVIWGNGFIEEQLGRIQFRIMPNTFFQINSVQFVRMLKRLLRLGNFQKEDQVLDLYCGVGTIGLNIAHMVDRVFGIDNNPDSISLAKENAKINNIPNVSYYSSDLQKKFIHKLPEDLKPNVIILNPPRKGLSKTLIAEIIEFKPTKIIYVSCNPKTLIADLAEFSHFDYHTNEIYPFDMFPHTSHVESLVVIQR